MRGLIASLLGERRIAVVSGGFDPIHSGHIGLIESAEEFGAVHVIVNSDEWLTRKKGAPFMEWWERAVVITALRPVAAVYRARDRDGSVTESLAQIRSLYPNHTITFCNGGDRGEGNTPEQEFCQRNGIRLAYNVGGGKTQSSSAILERHLKKGLSPSP